MKLMQIIVNSCCLTVPVNSTTVHTSNRETPTELHQGRVVLNYSPRRPSSVIRHPEVAVREILTKLVQLMKGKFLSSTNIKTICFLETFMNYLTSLTLICIITALQRSCKKECFQSCLSVYSGPFVPHMRPWPQLPSSPNREIPPSPSTILEPPLPRHV